MVLNVVANGRSCFWREQIQSMWVIHIQQPSTETDHVSFQFRMQIQNIEFGQIESFWITWSCWTDEIGNPTFRSRWKILGSISNRNLCWTVPKAQRKQEANLLPIGGVDVWTSFLHSSSHSHIDHIHSLCLSINHRTIPEEAQTLNHLIRQMNTNIPRK